MTSFVTSGMCIFKAGKGVNENFYSGCNLLVGSMSGQTVDNLISGAISVVNDMARENFSTDYATLSGDKKYLLEEMAANLVAIELVSYDMSGYSSRVDAEDIINVRRDALLRGLSIIRDQKVQDFIKK